MFGTESAILGHVAACLAHEPDRRTIDGLTPAGFEESVIEHFGILETRGRGCQFALGRSLFEQPFVHAEHCVGCGLCEAACVHMPQAIRVIPRDTEPLRGAV